jgi:mRNA interferase RelE/StbE
MKYAVEFTPQARREFDKLPDDVQDILELRLDALSLSPRPPGMKKMAGTDDLFRIRVGDYRIVYRIKDRVLLIVVMHVGHRKEVYRAL